MFLLNVGLSLTHTPSQMEMISQWNIKYDYLSMFWHQSEHFSKKGSYVLNPSLFLIYGIYLRTISNTQPSHEIVRYRLINTAYRNPLELNIFRELLDLIIKGMRKYIWYWERQSAVYIHKYCFLFWKCTNKWMQYQFYIHMQPLSVNHEYGNQFYFMEIYKSPQGIHSFTLERYTWWRHDLETTHPHPLPPTKAQ